MPQENQEDESKRGKDRSRWKDNDWKKEKVYGSIPEIHEERQGTKERGVHVDEDRIGYFGQESETSVHG